MLTSLIGDAVAASQPQPSAELDQLLAENTRAWVTSVHFLNSLAKLRHSEEQESL